MTAGRIIAALTASVAVGGCAVAVFGIGQASSEPAAAARSSVSAAPTSRPAYLPATTSSAPRAPVASARPARSTSAASQPTAQPRTSTMAPTETTAARAATTAVSRPTLRASDPARPAATSAPRRAASTTRAPAKPAGQRLPLSYSTGNAKRVITVTAASHGSTVATLQAWTKVAGGWKKYGTAMTAHVGSQGIGKASESSSRTPAGSFTMTQAFGRKSDPGTALPYFRTTPSDYWISDGGRLYNTHQRCSSCAYNDGVNERLYYETPYYNYAVVIDYNTRNAPGGVHAGRGSAFFLHVTDGRPTAGCVAISQSRLVSLMKWLTPSAHPRILIGVR